MTEKRKILITGANKGIGAAIARKLDAEDYVLILVGRNQEQLEEIKAELIHKENHVVIVANLASIDDCKELMGIVRREHKDLYGVINNAGITRDKALMFQPIREIEEVLQVNLMASILLGKLALKLFNQNKQGVVINMSSCVAETGNAFQSVYAASKAALISLSKSWTKEHHTICLDSTARFLTVSPGPIATNMIQSLGGEIKQAYIKNTPLNRFGKTEEVAELISFLISDKASYITGSNIAINGGIV